MGFLIQVNIPRDYYSPLYNQEILTNLLISGL